MLASAALSSHGFPEGTTVEAYPARQWMPGRAPAGSPADSAVVTDSTLAFGGLDEGLPYVAYAMGRGVQFVPDEERPAEVDGVPAGVWDRLGDLERVTARLLPAGDLLELLHDAADALAQDMVGFDSRTYPFGLRRSGEWRRPSDAVELATDDLSRQSWTGMSLVPDDSTVNAGPERINATAAGMALEFLGMLAQFEQRSSRSKVAADARRIADSLLPYQWPNDATLARSGGFMAGPSDTTAESFGTACAGLGMFEVWRATGDPRYLDSARRAADFLLVMADPNPKYQALHSVTPINRVANGQTWAGFLDSINNADKITTTSATVNIRACELLYQLDPIFPGNGYWAAGLPALNFMAQASVLGHDSFEVSGNANATWVAVGSFNDAAFHFASDALTTRGTDGIEYALAAMLRCGYHRATVRERWEYWRDQPALDTGPFGLVYDGAICLTGYMRSGGAYGSYWDTQGAGTLLALKALLDPASYRLSLGAIIPIGIRLGTILDENFKIIWSDSSFPDYVYATSGVIVRAQCAGGLLRAMRGTA